MDLAAEAREEPPPRLSARGLTKHFGATRALSGVSFSVHPGEVHALCGENGAGKSTLIKVLSGIYPHGSFEGAVEVDGVVQHFRGVRDAERAGIVVVHQELALVPELSAAENVFLGHEPRRMGLVDHARMLRESHTLLSRFGVAIDPALPARTLGVGQAQLVEIARALRKRARVLILDEPTAALSEREVSQLFIVLRELRQAGVALIYVSHRLREVFALSDRITVLRDGQSVVSLPSAETSEDEVVRHMVGRPLSSVFVRAPNADVAPPKPEPSAQAPLLRVRSLSVDGPSRSSMALHDISFDVHAGEILGIGGLVGAGRSELLLHLFGAWGRRVSGSVELSGEPLEQPTPARCLRRGMALVTEDRKEQGLVLEQSVGFNLSLSHLRFFARRGLVREALELRAQEELLTRVRLKPPTLTRAVAALSGGNQQKVVLGRALMTAPRVLLLDEPTRGVDIGAKLEIYGLIAEQCRAGMALVLVSSELPELLGLADRILMLVEGHVGGIFTRAEASEEQLLSAALRRPEAAPRVSREERP